MFPSVWHALSYTTLIVTFRSTLIHVTPLEYLYGKKNSFFLQVKASNCPDCLLSISHTHTPTPTTCKPLLVSPQLQRLRKIVYRIIYMCKKVIISVQLMHNKLNPDHACDTACIISSTIKSNVLFQIA